MNFIETILQFIGELWPLRKVEEWERGVYYVWGRAKRKILKPGVYPVVPWFIEVRPVSVVPNPVSTPLLDLTLADGRTLSFTITVIVEVVDPWTALNSIDDYKESCIELVASRAAEKLAEVDMGRLEPEKRKRLLVDLRRWVEGETMQYGVKIHALRFTNFVLNQRTYRLLMDSSQLSAAF